MERLAVGANTKGQSDVIPHEWTLYLIVAASRRDAVDQKLYKYCTSFSVSIVKPRGLFLVMKEAVASKVGEQFNSISCV